MYSYMTNEVRSKDPKIVNDFIPLSHFENADQLKIIFLVIHWSFPNTLAPTFLKQTIASLNAIRDSPRTDGTKIYSL